MALHPNLAAVFRRVDADASTVGKRWPVVVRDLSTNGALSSHRFRPRYRGLAFVSIGVGGSLAVVAGVLGFLALPFATGAIGMLMGGGYLASPAWRLEIVADDDKLVVRTPRATRFTLAW